MSRRGALGALAAGVGSFLLEPAEEDGAGAGVPSSIAPPLGTRPVVAVFGLARGCGTTTVARALAAELGCRDPSGTAAVECEPRSGGVPLAARPAARLARMLARSGRVTRAHGRICLVHAAGDPAGLVETLSGVAPLVIDAGSGAVGGVCASLATRSVLVTTPALEPSLAELAGDCLERVGPPPLVTVNRSRDDPAHSPEWLLLPESRMGAGLALSGRESRGELGRAVGALADLCAEPLA